MQENIRTDIIDSYNKLIEACKVNIENEVEVNKNELLMKEYSCMLKRVEKKTEEEYESESNDIEKLYEVSLAVMRHLAPLMPYKEIAQ